MVWAVSRTRWRWSSEARRVSARPSPLAWAVKAHSVVIADIDRPMMDATVSEMCAEGSEARRMFCDVRDASPGRSHGRSGDRMVRPDRRADVRVRDRSARSVSRKSAWPPGTTPSTPTCAARFLVSKAVTPHMVARRRGNLVFMASTNCWDAEASLAHYNASKAGVFLLAKTLATRIRSLRHQLQCLGPRFHQNPFDPTGPERSGSS